jgi:Uma2 family endonuclease
MAQPLPQHLLEEYDMVEVAAEWEAAIDNLETEDDTPVDNLFSAKQQRLLAHALYSSWTPPPNDEHPEEKRKFLADANVGVFSTPFQPPIVPDVFVSLDVEPHRDWYAKNHRSYFVWEFKKAPDVVVEIVSNRKGGELSEKLRRYAQIDVTYYLVYDPQQLLSTDTVRVYERGCDKQYHLRQDLHLPQVGLCVTLWEGEFEGYTTTWLRWCDTTGNVIPTGEERARQEATARQAAEARATQAEAELARLREELERLKGKTSG